MKFWDSSAIVPLPTTLASAAVERVRKLERTWHQVAPTDVLRQRAQRLLDAAQREGLVVEPT